MGAYVPKVLFLKLKNMMKIIGLFLCCCMFMTMFAQKEEVLKAGMESPDFKYKDVNGKTVSLKELRGKYVYIDVWATWCTPCRGELPYLKELEEKLKGKNICFLSISCDKDVEKWKQMVKDEKLGGIHVNTGGDQAFMKSYGIKGIPRFILLDKEGKIISMEMTRPSQKVTLETLMKLEGID